MVLVRLLIVGFLSLSLLVTKNVRALDFDNDGLSDIVVINPMSDGTLHWGAQDSNDLTQRDLGIFGKLGNEIIAGKWTANSVKAVVASDAGSKASWNIESANTFSFASLGARAIAGLDLDKDTLLDAISVSNYRGRMLWQIRKSTNQKTSSIIFGSNGDLPVIFKDSKGIAKIAVIKKTKPYRVLHARSISSPRISKISLRSSEAFESYKQGAPILWSIGVPAIVFSRKDNSGLKLVVVSVTNGKVLKRISIPNAVEISVGDFLGTGLGQIAVQSNQGTVQVLSISGLQDFAVRADGILVDDFNSNTIKKASNPTNPVSPTPVQTPVAMPKPTNPLNPVECILQDSTDGGGGFVWKPVSDTQRFAVTVFPPTFTGIVGRVDMWSNAGVYIKELRGKGAGNGNRTAWQDNSLTGNDYKRTYGTVLVVGTNYSGGCSKWEISDPSRRVD